MAVNSHYFNKNRLQALHEFADQQIAQNNFAGIAWSLEHEGCVVDEGLHGCSDHALKQPLQTDTLYRLYSMT